MTWDRVCRLLDRCRATQHDLTLTLTLTSEEGIHQSILFGEWGTTNQFFFRLKTELIVHLVCSKWHRAAQNTPSHSHRHTHIHNSIQQFWTSFFFSFVLFSGVQYYTRRGWNTILNYNILSHTLFNGNYVAYFIEFAKQQMRGCCFLFRTYK